MTANSVGRVATESHADAAGNSGNARIGTIVQVKTQGHGEGVGRGAGQVGAR